MKVITGLLPLAVMLPMVSQVLLMVQTPLPREPAFRPVTGNFTLQSATNVSGPYTDLQGPIVVGPYTTNPNSATQQFFRLRQ